MHSDPTQAAEPIPIVDLHVALILNFLAPDIAAICRAWRARVKRLDVMISVPMEANRQWTGVDVSAGSESQTLQPIVQRTWTWTRKERHESFTDYNYVHIPLDTLPLLWKMAPDVIVASELGARSLQAAIYKRLHRRTRLVLSVSTSEHLERERNRGVRKWLRRWLIRQADAVTYHGESCRRFCESLGATTDQLRLWNYAADPSKIHRESLVEPMIAGPLKLLTVGQLIDRKGIEPTAQELVEWCELHPTTHVHWTLVGSGPLETWLRSMDKPKNLLIELLGHQSSSELRAIYRQHELMLFPTLGDEWGLVVDEAMMSGLVVIGSRYAQSCETLIHGSQNERAANGQLYDPLQTGELSKKLDWWLGLSAAEKLNMREQARRDSMARTPNLPPHRLRRFVKKLQPDTVNTDNQNLVTCSEFKAA